MELRILHHRGAAAAEVRNSGETGLSQPPISGVTKPRGRSSRGAPHLHVCNTHEALFKSVCFSCHTEANAGMVAAVSTSSHTLHQAFPSTHPHPGGAPPAWQPGGCGALTQHQRRSHDFHSTVKHVIAKRTLSGSTAGGSGRASFPCLHRKVLSLWLSAEVKRTKQQRLRHLCRRLLPERDRAHSPHSTHSNLREINTQ